MIDAHIPEMAESTDIAIIGMAGRFPGAETVDAFWQNLCQGVESVTHFTDEELLRAGVNPALLHDENYVKAGAILHDIDLFDAAFFGLTPQEARVMDPQQRLFLECAWNALEHAGYHAETYQGIISLFGGSGLSTYLLNNLYANADAVDATGLLQMALSNDKDSLATRVAYLLNLTGPCYTVQTYCSTSLVATCIACSSLLNGECDMALAGGVALTIPQKAGYAYQEGGVASPDARCRAFDAEANGSPLGNGVGVVVLKRLADALKDGDTIHALIKGSAINNDGALKVGYTAPGVRGQTRVILEALANAEVPAESISYIEAHGTGTALGDAVELTALLKAFQSHTQNKYFCALGSVKTNVGHLDRAAGVTGLIKTVQALKHRQIPPSLNYHEPNKQVSLHDSPFYVNTRLAEWTHGTSPRRAGVSAFGIGGTNAHVILEEAPERTTTPPLRSHQLLVLSARSQSALEAATRRLGSHLREHPELPLADVAYTLQVGRKVFEYRRAFVCRDRDDALAQLAMPLADHGFESAHPATMQAVAFVFSGERVLDQPAVAELYAREITFRTAIERCQRYLITQHALDLQQMLLPVGPGAQSPAQGEPLCAFVIQYALAQVMMAWGVVPAALSGWGIGEYVAACLAGVFTLEDALELVIRQSEGALGKRLHLAVPTIPLLSAATGSWMTEELALDVEYWMHVPQRSTSTPQGVQSLLEKAQLWLEIGGPLSLEQPSTATFGAQIVGFSDAAGRVDDSVAALLRALGKLWVAGSQVDWAAFTVQEDRQRVPLPTYPFERQRYWIDPPVHPVLPLSPVAQPDPEKKADAAQWFYRRSWQEQPLPSSVNVAALDQQGPFLVFLDTLSVGERLVERLTQEGHTVFSVQPGTQFARLTQRAFSIRAQSSSDYSELLQQLRKEGMLPRTVVYCSSIGASNVPTLDSTRFETFAQEHIYSLLHLARALGREFADDNVQLFIISQRGQDVTGREELQPEQAMLPALAVVIAQECFTITCRCIDLDIEQGNENASSQGMQQVLEMMSAPADTLTAYRANRRWVQHYDPIRLERSLTEASPLRQRGVYLITGGLGNVGLALAERLARDVQARLVLVGRSPVPPRQDWEGWVQAHGSADPVSQKITRLLKLEHLGADVFLAQADVANEQQMRVVLEQIDERYGTLHGVIHAAGLTAEQAFRVIEELGPQECQWHFQPKIHGVFTLEKVLRGRDLDFCVLFSSLSAILGGLGFFAYSAANAFMDAVIHRYNAVSAFPWISIDWDTWQFPQEKRQSVTPGQTVAMYAMTPDEGVDAFQRILAARDQRHIVVSTGDLQPRIRQWVHLESMRTRVASPLTASHSETKHAAPTASMPLKEEYEQKIRETWQQVLGITDLAADANFFDLGGNSLLGLQVIANLKKAFHIQIPAVALYEAPTISALVTYLLPKEEPQQERARNLTQRRQQARRKVGQQDIAIIGMAGRFPGAATLEQFWHNLRNGVESITFFTDEELLAAGVDATTLRQPNYIKARPVLDQVDQFDAAFFGYSPREAELMDPQHRLFMECSWEALETAGYDPLTYQGLIGVFAGANISTYLLSLAMQTDALAAFDEYQIVMGNDKDSLTTSVSYKLNLKGPSFAVQTFCSTSLVATHLGCQSLLSGECDIALAGGVSVRVPSRVGYLYNEGGMESPDGHCRTFDAQAKGTLFGDGVGVVVMKRLEDALADGDPICAVIKGSAINNDGSLKVSYTAPSVVGQAEVVMAALAAADIEADTIEYIEAHGTATELGDPIELASLTKAFRVQTDKVGFCALGSVKTNFGHLDRAAGASGLIKTVLALQHEEIPPSLHYQQPNPKIDFEHSPFYVNTRVSPWVRGSKKPRRAGINSLGMGGTNAHIVLEEAPLPRPSSPARPDQLLVLSARTASALERYRENLLAYLQQHEEANLADIAYTLQVGRHRFDHRLMLVCRDRAQVIADLKQDDAARVLRRCDQHADRPVVLLFPGVGEQYPGMARELFAQQPYFRQVVQECCRYLQEQHGLDLLPLLQLQSSPDVASSPAETGPAQQGPALDLRALLKRGAAQSLGTNPLRATELAHPAVFVLEYALARLLLHWGVVPQALLGYSLGEYVAACVSGALNWQEALRVVTERARLIAQLPAGKMLAVMLSEEEVAPYMHAGVGLAAVNAPQTCVLAGEPSVIDAVARRIQEQGRVCREVEADHAFHTEALQPVAEALRALLRTVKWQEPEIPFISNVTGQWVQGEEVRDEQYWVRQMCETVRWKNGVGTLLEKGEQIIIEVGAGQALSSFVRQHEQCNQEQMGLVLGLVPAEQEREGQMQRWWSTLGKLWLAGGKVDWDQGWQGEQRQRLVLPTYPFERQRYWIESQGPSWRTSVSGPAFTDAQVRLESLKREELAQWFYLPAWKQSLPSQPTDIPGLLQQRQCWLIFADDAGAGRFLQRQLEQHNQDVVMISADAVFKKQDVASYTLVPTDLSDYERLLNDLLTQGKTPQKIIHLWSIASGTTRSLPDTLEHGFFSLMYLVQALSNAGIDTCDLTVITSDVHEVIGGEPLQPEKATILGACRVIPLEYPAITCRTIDISSEDFSVPHDTLLQHLMAEVLREAPEPIVALRRQHRWIQTFETIRLPEPEESNPASRLRERGVYLITGGLGGIGLAMAEHLAQHVQARLALLSRSALPPRQEWSSILASQQTSAEMTRKIRQVQRLEELGAEVLILSADVANEEQVQAALQQIISRFGTLHGVIHAAGMPGIGLMQMKTAEMSREVLAPKVMGTLVLDRVLRNLDHDLDFLALYSSITSMTGGGPGQADYCAANAFLDAFAHRNAPRHGRTVAINWGEWQWNAWDAGLSGYDSELQRFFRTHRQRFGIHFDEGFHALICILGHMLPQVIVSTQNFPSMIELSTSFTVASVAQKAQKSDTVGEAHARPALANQYIAPRNDIEEAIARLWEEFLGMEGIGVYDTFFELGGHSLIGTQIVLRMRELFRIHLPMSAFFEAPTIAELAVLVELAFIEEIENSEHTVEQSAH